MSENIIHQESHCGYRIVIEKDLHPENPINYNGLGKLVYYSKKIPFGNERVFKEDIDELIARDEIVHYNVYRGEKFINHPHYGEVYYIENNRLLDNEINCGIIYVTKEKAKKKFPNDPEWFRQAQAILEIEFDRFIQYKAGNVLKYTIYDLHEGEDECGDEEERVETQCNFYSETVENLVTIAKLDIDCLVEKKSKQLLKRAYYSLGAAGFDKAVSEVKAKCEACK